MIHCDQAAYKAGVSEDDTKVWLMKQAIWQIYLPAHHQMQYIKLVFFPFLYFSRMM